MHHGKLKREIGIIGLTFVGVSGVIGSGWLFAPLMASQMAGPAAIVAWLLGGIAMALLALTFAEITASLPVAGGIARVPQFSHGNVVSMAMGWSAWVGYNTAAPIEVEAMLSYLAPHLQWLYLVDESGNMSKTLSTYGLVTACFLLAIFTVINLVGVRFFTRINSSITWVKIVIPIVVAGALIYDNFEWGNFHSYDGFAPMGMKGILASISTGGIIFAYIGFRHAIDMAGEAKNPKVTVPLALILSIVICFLVYGMMQIGFMGALPADSLDKGWAHLHFEGKFGPISGLATALGIVWLVSLLNAGAVISPFGGGLVAVGSMGRLAHAMARNGFFPRMFERLSRRGVPANALILNFLVASVVFIALPFNAIVSLNSSAIILSFTVGPIAVVALRKLDPERPRSFQLPFLGVTAPMAFIVSTLIIYWSGWDTFIHLSLCLVAGVVLFAIRLRYKKEEQMNWREATWLIPYLLGMGLLSFAGDFGGGMGWIPFGWDLLIVSIFSLVIFVYAVRSRLPRETYQAYLEEEYPSTKHKLL